MGTRGATRHPRAFLLRLLVTLPSWQLSAVPLALHPALHPALHSVLQPDARRFSLAQPDGFACPFSDVPT